METILRILTALIFASGCHCATQFRSEYFADDNPTKEIFQFYSGADDKIIYRWGYDFPGQGHSEQKYSNDEVHGRFHFIDANGEKQSTVYKAHPTNGFVLQENVMEKMAPVDEIEENLIAEASENIQQEENSNVEANKGSIKSEQEESVDEIPMEDVIEIDALSENNVLEEEAPVEVEVNEQEANSDGTEVVENQTDETIVEDVTNLETEPLSDKVEEVPAEQEVVTLIKKTRNVVPAAEDKLLPGNLASVMEAGNLVQLGSENMNVRKYQVLNALPAEKALSQLALDLGVQLAGAQVHDAQIPTNRISQGSPLVPIRYTGLTNQESASLHVENGPTGPVFIVTVRNE